MSRGYWRSLTCCDRDCAVANGCRMGGYQCHICGRWYCGEEMHDVDHCSDCWEDREREEGEENDDE